MIELRSTRYGKARVHVVRVHRGSDGRHVVRDVVVRVALEGDFDEAHTAGDNSHVVATDTMKNTCYVIARDHLGGALEEYGWALAEHFLGFPQVARSTVWLAEHRWDPIATSGGRGTIRCAIWCRPCTASSPRCGSTPAITPGVRSMPPRSATGRRLSA